MTVQKDEEPEDPERRVSFDFVCGFLVEFAKKETRFRLLYTFLTILGVQLPERQAPASRCLIFCRIRFQCLYRILLRFLLSSLIE
jgi:hypothetical protein